VPGNTVSALDQYTICVRIDKVVVEEVPPYCMHKLALEVGVEFVCRRLSVFLDIEILEVVR
jgi:hypothetical protein